MALERLPAGCRVAMAYLHCMQEEAVSGRRVTRRLEDEILEEATDKACSNIIPGMTGAMVTQGDDVDFHIVEFTGEVREVQADEEDPSMKVPTNGGGEKPYTHRVMDKVHKPQAKGQGHFDSTLTCTCRLWTQSTTIWWTLQSICMCVGRQRSQSPPTCCSTMGSNYNHSKQPQGAASTRRHSSKVVRWLSVRVTLRPLRKIHRSDGCGWHS